MVYQYPADPGESLPPPYRGSVKSVSDPFDKQRAFEVLCAHVGCACVGLGGC